MVASPISAEDSLDQCSLEQMSQHIQKGQLTSVALTKACLARISQKNEALHAFSEVFSESALTEAAQLDAELSNGQCRGPLHGIPVGIKDLADVKGSITTFGSQVYSHAPANGDAACVQRLRDAGMVILGKLHMVEFALGSWGTNASCGTPINPWDTKVQRVAGGSSSGSAVAVASKMVPCALGSDTGGSIRIPSSLCGLVGLKTSGGVVDKAGVAPLSPTLDTIGPIARSVGDIRLLLKALTGQSYPSGVSDLTTQSAGLLEAGILDPLDSEVEDAFVEVITTLRARGLHTESLQLPLPTQDYQQRNGEIMAYEGYRHVGHLVSDYTLPMDPFVRARMLAGRGISEQRYAEALEHRKQSIEDFLQATKSLDVVLLPTTALPAQPLSEADETIMPMSRLTRWGSYLDLCGVSLPIGLTHEGLPIGLQILGKGQEEATVLRFAAAVETALKDI